MLVEWFCFGVDEGVYPPMG